MQRFDLKARLEGHTGAITSVAVPDRNTEMLVSGSRDKSLMVWKLSKSVPSDNHAIRSLHGHNHFVSDIALSLDGHYALSGSWDGTLRLWDLLTGATSRRFIGHTKDVMSVAFSADNRQIISASRDRSIRVWNTLGECKFRFEDGGHTDWVSCVRFSPNPERPLFVSGSWDHLVKVWDVTHFKLERTLAGHTGYINTVAISPDGSLSASGGKDGSVLVWNNATGENISAFEAGSIVNSIAFNPGRLWLSAATDRGVRIWDISSKKLVADLTQNHPDFLPNTPNPASAKVAATAAAWSRDGSTVYVGYSDGVIRVWECPVDSQPASTSSN